MVFSRRIAWSLEPNDYSKLVERKRLSGTRVLDLTESNPTRAGFDYPLEILQGLADPGALLYEPTPWGLLSARQAVASEHSVDADRVMLTASTSESYGYLFKLLCNPGDRVLVPKPSYPLFEFLAKLENVEVAQYSLVYDGRWRIDFDSVRNLITPRTRALLVVNPNNPTGSYVASNEIEEIARLGLPVVSDEVFHGYSFGAIEPTDWGPVAERALVVQLNGLSKMAGLPQMKAGWMILDGPESIRREAGQRLELIADTFLSVSTPVQHALPGLLLVGRDMRRQIRERCRANLDWLRTVAEPLDVEGGWSAIVRLPPGLEDSEFVLSLLDQQNVMVQPGFFYDFEGDGFIVLSVLTRTEDFQAGVERMASFNKADR